MIRKLIIPAFIITASGCNREGETRFCRVTLVKSQNRVVWEPRVETPYPPWGVPVCLDVAASGKAVLALKLTDGDGIQSTRHTGRVAAGRFVSSYSPGTEFEASVAVGTTSLRLSFEGQVDVDSSATPPSDGHFEAEYACISTTALEIGKNCAAPCCYDALR